MTTAEIQRIQERIGVKPDGFWGPISTAAAKAHLAKLAPTPNPFPVQSRVSEFYGAPGVPGGFTPPQRKIALPFTVYYEGNPVTHLRPHEKCADRLLAVFHRLAEIYPDEASRRAAGILTYDGLYHPRAMRGGTARSMHSWAIAIDLDAARNGNAAHWPMASSMPIEVMECFAAEGWLSAGAFWSRDAMHFQATR
jgi:hypothetical protein